MSKPVVGVICGTDPAWRVDGDAYKSYASSVERFGAVCVPLDLERRHSLAECDGLLIPGGWDLHPNRFDRMPGDEDLSAEDVILKYKMTCEEPRDPLDLENISEAVQAGKPFLGICRGFQAVNVALAHKLIPDLPSCVPNVLSHAAKDGVSASHEISIEPDSWMERVYGAGRITINSRHHQGVTVDMVSERMRVTAVAPDGVVEAMELLDACFGVVVQWHPERKADSYIYDPSGPLFEAFVKACGGEK